MQIFSYTLGNDAANIGLIEKAGLDLPIYKIDFADGINSGVTLGAVTYGTVNSSNTDVTSTAITSVSTTGTVVTVNMLTCGTSGSQAAIDGARFRNRVRVTLSDSRQLQFDTYVIVRNPTYSPDA